MTAAAQNSQSWQATGSAKERATLEEIESSLEAKRRFRGELDGVAAGEYTSYRRGAARDAWEADHKQSQQSSSSALATSAKEFAVMSQARRITAP